MFNTTLMKRILTLAVLLITMSATLFAQSGYQVKGVVVDKIGPVIGATLVEKGSSNGTSTGLDGDFTLNVSSKDAIVEISCIGYTTQSFKASEMPAKITISEDALFLEDVVVIGYGTVKKDDLTGSVATVKADDLNKGAVTSPAELIRGKSAGVVVTSGNGMPGSGSTIRIRGGSSLSATNDPLIIIDGLPVSNEGISGMSDPLSSINPSDIESFTVLKDASATAIYGSRASNGVVVITTKKGKRGQQGIKFSLDYQHSLSSVMNTVDVMNAAEIKEAIKTYIPNHSEEALAALGEADTDWQDQIYHLANSDELNFSAVGNFAPTKDIAIPVRFSLGALNNQGTLKTSEMQRGTASLNISPKLFDNHLKINLNGKGTYQSNVYANQGAIGAAVFYDPTKPIKDENGEYTAWKNEDGSYNTMATQNPVALLNQMENKGHATRFIGNAQFDYKIHGFEDLRLNLNLGLDWAKGSGHTEVEQNSEMSFHDGNQNGSGSHSDYDYLRRDQTLEFYANYNHKFGTSHNLDAMAGYSWQHFYNDSFSEAYKLSDGTALGSPHPFATEYFLVSFFSRLNYSYADKYLVTATVRRDGTSRFQNNKWGLFPSLALGWNAKKEGFLADFEPMSTAKLRLSWGETGQQDINQGNYPTIGTYKYNTNGSYYDFNGEVIKPISPCGYNPDLKWETTTTYNIGVDLGFIDDRIKASFDVYNRKTSDLINFIPVAAGSALTNYLTTNIGDMENYGVEADMNFILISTEDMGLTFGVNGAYNHNEITKLTAAKDDNSGVETGGISGGTGNNVQMHMVGHAASSFYVFEQIYDVDGNPIDNAYVDRNNDGVINASDKHFFHKPAPDVTFGMNIQFDYKNWTAALSGHGSVGNYNYNNVASNSEASAELWTNNFVSNRLNSAVDSKFESARYLTDYYIQDASFFKLDNFTLGYTFPELIKFGNVAEGGHTLSLNLFTTVQNIYTFTKYDGLDPEVFGGIDGMVYPRPRTFIVGAKFNF